MKNRKREKDELGWELVDGAPLGNPTWRIAFEYYGWRVQCLVRQRTDGGFDWNWTAETGVGRHARHDMSHAKRSAMNGSVRSARKWIEGTQKP